MKWNITPIYLIYAFESYNIYILYPFLAFLLLHYKIISEISNAGYYLSMFSASYAIGQTVGGKIWGSISDKIGRKKLFVFSLFIYILSFLMFGFSVNFYMALIARFLAGILCSNMANTRAYLSDVTTNETSAFYFGLLPYFWYIGSICGSLIGGYSYNSYFFDFPALFPCLISCGLLILIIFTTLIILPENRDNTLSISEYYSKICQKNENTENTENIVTLSYIYNNTNIKYGMLSYIFLVFIDYSISEITPLLLVTSKKYGGFEYKSQQIGILFMIASAIAFITQPLFNILEKRIKRKKMISVFFVFIAIFIFLTPFIPKMTDDSLIRYIIIIGISAMRFSITSWCYNLTSIFQSLVSKKEKNGQIFGISQTIVSILVIICSLSFSPLFSYTATSQIYIFLFDQHFIFNIFSIFVLLPIIFVHKIDDSIERDEDAIREINSVTPA
jgi:MFS family permease